MDQLLLDSGTAIAPGCKHTYTIHVPCFHAGGTFLYYAHHQGTSEAQSGRGFGGALIVADSSTDAYDSNAWSTYLSNITQQIVSLSHLDASLIQGEEQGKKRYSSNDTRLQENAWLVNGELYPPMPVHVNAWERWRFLYQSPSTPIHVRFEKHCDILLIAKEGTYVMDIPRRVERMYFDVVSTVEILIRCSNHSDMYINEMPSGFVYTHGETVRSHVPSWTPRRAPYQDNLLSRHIQFQHLGYVTLQKDSIKAVLPHGKALNGRDLKPGNACEAVVCTSLNHVLHIKTYAFQLTHAEECSFLNKEVGIRNWYLPGDWQSTIRCSKCIHIRFRLLPSAYSFFLSSALFSEFDAGSSILLRFQNGSIM